MYTSRVREILRKFSETVAPLVLIHVFTTTGAVGLGPSPLLLLPLSHNLRSEVDPANHKSASFTTQPPSPYRYDRSFMVSEADDHYEIAASNVRMPLDLWALLEFGIEPSYMYLNSKDSGCIHASRDPTSNVPSVQVHPKVTRLHQPYQLFSTKKALVLSVPCCHSQ